MKYVISFLLLFFPFSLIGREIDDFPVSENNFAETFSEQLPSVASNSSGNFVVVWMDEREGDYTIYGQLFTSEGSPIGGNFKVNQFTFEENAAPSISMNAEGRFVVTWTQGNDIYARRFDENGNPISSAFKVNDDIGHKHTSPAVFLFDGGEFVIVWQDTRNATWSPDIFAQFYTSDGSPYLTNFIVNDHTGGEQGFPAVAISSFDTYTITWMDSREGNFDIYAQNFWWSYPMGSNNKVNDDITETGQYTPVISTPLGSNRLIVWQDYREDFPNIYASRLDYSGPISTNFKVNDNVDTCWRGNPSVSSISNGYMVVWEDERNGNKDIYAQMYDANANPIGCNFRVNYGADSLLQTYPCVTGDSFGGVVVFQDEKIGDYDVYFQRYDSMGVSQGSNTIVTSNLYGGHQTFSAISTPYNGEFVVIWQDLRAHNWDIYIQRIDSSGSLLGNNIVVNDDSLLNEQILPSVGKDSSGNFVTVWMDSRNNEWDIYGAIFDAYGNPISSNFKINDDTLRNDQSFPDVAKNINGGFIVTWSCVWARRYDKNGNPLGNAFRVNDDTISGFLPSVAISNNSNFIITFTGSNHIYASLFDSTGAPVGTNFRVDDDSTSAEKFSPQLGIDASGNFVISWEDLRNTEPDIYAQRFDSAGNPNGCNFKVNDDGWGNEQYLPSVAVSPQGRFIISWMDNRNGNFNIYCQRYLSDGSIYGQNFKVNNNIGLCQQTDVDVSIDNDGKMFFTWTDTRRGISGSDIFVKIMGFETGVQSKKIEPGNKMLSLEIYPNPFSQKTIIQLTTNSSQFIDKNYQPLTVNCQLQIYDVAGRLVRSFSLFTPHSLLITSISWDGRDDEGKEVRSGIYFLKLKVKSEMLNPIRKKFSNGVNVEKVRKVIKIK